MAQGFAGMSNKLKFVLGGLIVVAGFFVYRAIAFLVPDKNKTAIEQRLSQAPLTATISEAMRDSDRDGLPDLRETDYGTNIRKADTDGDGYIDGEEVISDYDPTQAANDNLHADKNVTELFLHRLMAGVYAGDLNPHNNDQAKQDAGLKSLSLATIFDAQSVITKDTDTTAINVVPDTEENIKEYTAFLQINLRGNAFYMPFAMQGGRLDVAIQQIDSGNTDKAVTTFTMYERFFEKQSTIWQNASVPKMFTTFHKMFLEYLMTMEGHYRAASNIKSDPMLAQIALTAIPMRNDKIMKDVADELLRIMTDINVLLPKKSS